MLEDEKIHLLRQSLRENLSCKPHILAISPKSENSSRSCGCIPVLYLVLHEPCLPASDSLGILALQILIILPQHFDYNDNKYNNIANEDNGHRYDE